MKDDLKEAFEREIRELDQKIDELESQLCEYRKSRKKALNYYRGTYDPGCAFLKDNDCGDQF